MTLNINVLMGGPSAEHEVSLHSGMEVCANLNQKSYRIRAVVISREKEFFYCNLDGSVPQYDEFANPHVSSLFKGPLCPFLCRELWDGCDAALLALHGSFGEDGKIQGYLDTIGVPYTGSGVYASAVAMNKITSKLIYEHCGLTVPPYSIFGKNNLEVSADDLIRKHGLPCFIKCPHSGSSRLMGCAKEKKELLSLLGELLKESPDLLVETAIQGTEFSCGILEKSDGDFQALPPIEIRPVRSNFFDYEAKYTTGASEEIVPAPQPKHLLEEIQNVSLTAHKLLGCRGYSRTDMIYADSSLYVLETNTIPGMTSNSLLPKAFKATGGTFSELLDLLISSAIAKRNI